MKLQSASQMNERMMVLRDGISKLIVDFHADTEYWPNVSVAVEPDGRYEPQVRVVIISLYPGPNV